MDGNKVAKKMYCDCAKMTAARCKHCQNHLKGFVKRYWNKWNKRRLDTLWHKENDY